MATRKLIWWKSVSAPKKTMLPGFKPTMLPTKKPWTPKRKILWAKPVPTRVGAWSVAPMSKRK